MYSSNETHSQIVTIADLLYTIKCEFYRYQQGLKMVPAVRVKEKYRKSSEI
jgi:hypothetical protein